MKLQLKLILYNLIIKISIIIFLVSVILIFLDKISLNHLKQRIADKKEKLIKNLSEDEIADLLEAEKTFTDYNILKEEYIILTRANPAVTHKTHPEKFNISNREIEGHQGEYLILTSYLRFGQNNYRLEIGETVSAVRQLKKTILYLTLLALVISAVITLITDYAFTSMVLAPFYNIIDQKLNKTNEPFEYDYNPIKTTTSDFRQLDDSINALMHKITQQFLTQKQFTSNVSHELLTPVSVIKTRLENLLADEKISETSEAKIMASLRSLDRLKSIVNSLLLISKIENDQYEKKDLISIRSTLSEVIEDLEDRMELKGICLTNSLNHNSSIYGNKALIHILFTNIINNATKYNRPGGEIRLEDKLEKDCYNIYISDQGKGMSQDLVEKAFNRFEKLNSSDNDSNGLGLAIVKSIAVFHGLDIVIESEPGSGTTVIISFSQSAVHPAPFN